MEASEYRILYELETQYWWFRNLHDMLTDLLEPHDRVLDAGCGTGGFMLRLHNAYGLDISTDAARFWDERGIRACATLASINEIPYPDNHFDAVTSIDILECDGVYDKQAYSELVRVTRPGGRIIIVVPAYQWMMTEGHHKAVHAIRRYNKQTARALADGCSVEIERITHAFAVLFPIVAGIRLHNRWQEQRGTVEIKSELQPLNPLVNSALYRLTNVERYLLRYINMPFGSSLIMVARKQ